MKREVLRRPKGELCKVQFVKTITVVGKTTFDEETDKYHIQGLDFKTGQPVNSWINKDDMRLIEDANSYEKNKFERQESSLGKRPPDNK